MGLTLVLPHCKCPGTGDEQANMGVAGESISPLPSDTAIRETLFIFHSLIAVYTDTAIRKKG